MRMAAVEVGKTTGSHECGGCGKRINDRYLLKAVDLYWHEDCLKCGCCDCRLGEVGSTLYKKANLLLCKRDYLRLFGTTGHCAACNKVIPAFEMVMRAKTNVYHLECFACQQCNHRFCVGDRFYLCDNKILCEYDYEERMVFANMSYSSDSLAHIKRQQPPEESNMAQRGAAPPLGPTLPPQHHQQQQPQQQQQHQHPHQHQQQQMMMNGLGLGGGGPGTSGLHLPGGVSDRGLGDHHHLGEGGGGGGSGLKAPPPTSAPPQPNSSNHAAAADDASSGYGSPDSLTMEDR
ncbi:insulin gene enhancer protein ISL-3-like isoform X2 [Penaeus japonicus]|uniref:insulin gene enhancer protein ISL-3-like isoform X2 n=1 Tax=Penaeus japonicus TaxID=27405 RepID=UPI001C713643|nr:insulin gene enhancer protein ISL-3-like isoform X2 [Penaeus japonicus]